MKERILILLLMLQCWVVSLCALEPFSVHDVRLLDSRWRDNVRRDSAWICSFTTQQMLHSFRTTAGVYSAYEGGYDVFAKFGGWESLDCDLRGHAIGHLMTAYAYAYASTGYDIYRLKGDSLVQGIRECQRMIGTGYVSAFPEGLINRNIAGKSVWAPWYTLHKVMSGLRAQADLCGSDTAAVIIRDFTDWAVAKVKDVPDRARMLRNEFGGIAEPIPALREYFYDAAKLDPLYAGDFDMGTMHTNTFLPKMLVECHKHPGDSMPVRFFEQMVNHHCYASGSISDKEHFFAPGEMSKHLSGYTGESCCTYNMLRLARELYKQHPDNGLYMDYYERALVNHILGQQDPTTGMVHYFLPMLTGGYKLYCTPMHSFWCCVGTGFENPMRFTESIYWHNNATAMSAKTSDTIYVNLFIASRLDWKEKGLVLRQETAFPRSDQSCLIIEQAPKEKMTIAVRIPSWTGKKGGYKYYTRRWKTGDKIAISLPMRLTEVYTPDSTRVAYMYGPILLAGRLGKVDKPFSNPTKHNDYYTFNYQVPDSIQTVGAPIELQSTGLFGEFVSPEGIVVSPLYDIHHERYVVYWQK